MQTESYKKIDLNPQVEKVKPYQNSEEHKKVQIETMFDNIAHKYDFLNHVLSAGIDILWRKKAIKTIASIQPKTILDMATGTGDFAFEALKLQPDMIYGVDLSQNMLDVGIEKSKERGTTDRIAFIKGDAEKLSFEDDYFDAITVGFGVRNFSNLKVGLSELQRVLKPNGMIVILEPSFPSNVFLKSIFQIHFKYITPLVGKLFSKDDAAYKYLPDSVEAFPQGKQFTDLLEECQFKNTKHLPLSFGICAMYTASK